ncbi:vitamin K epoxide reductase family protein [Microbacterium luticocti]|uniref:vitamin K epoxide reductase family protein n=1 Tax=Microbacterium luticocti TaxID=451764 RepID=UPI00048F576F|nr:vitamin K epoxide reductase family protein [Microbacterium luticocti]
MSSPTAGDVPAPADRPIGLAVLLVAAGALGWWAAFRLTLEHLHALEHPGAVLGCDISVLVQCGDALDSPQGSVFGFSNALLGVAFWVVPVIVGAAILAGARFARWFWLPVWLGTAGAFAFVCWFVVQSVFVLHALCPWCMLTWAVTIPMFLAVTVHVLRAGHLPAGAGVRRAAAHLMAWVPPATIVLYGVIVLVAQVRLGAVVNIWHTFFG